MTQPQSSIFRQEAVRHRYGGEQPVLPRFVSTTVLISLWLLTALLAVGGIAAWSTPLRVPISGVAVVIGGRTVVAFLSAHSGSHLRIGQTMHLSDDGGQVLSTPIVSIDPEVVSPEVACRRYRLDQGIAQAIRGPAAVAIARCESTSSRVYHVTLAGGSRPLFSIFPLIGRALETQP
jgi:hypothetical protein